MITLELSDSSHKLIKDLRFIKQRNKVQHMISYFIPFEEYKVCPTYKYTVYPKNAANKI